MKVLAINGFEKNELIFSKFQPKQFGIPESKLIITTKGGFLGKKHEFYKNNFTEVIIINETKCETSTNTRIARSVVGAVILGPIGLLAGAVSTSNQIFKIKAKTICGKTLVCEFNYLDAKRFLSDFSSINLDEYINTFIIEN